MNPPSPNRDAKLLCSKACTGKKFVEREREEEEEEEKEEEEEEEEEEEKEEEEEEEEVSKTVTLVRCSRETFDSNGTLEREKKTTSWMDCDGKNRVAY